MNKLRAARFFRGINQSKLALLSGIHQSEISRLENDLLPESPTTQRKKEQIAQVLGVKESELFSESQ